jgi:hypothetical protein
MVGEDGNAFAIMGRFARQARRAGWTAEQITALREQAMQGDYDHLVTTYVPYVDWGDDDE